MTEHPTELPERPERPDGWTRCMVSHMRVQGGGIGTFDVFDAEGRPTPIGFVYRSGKNAIRGFTLPEVEGVMTWAALREKWPEWRKSQETENA